MRVSMFKDDRGFDSAESTYPSKVYVDGKLVNRVVRLDDVEGWVDIHADNGGKLLFTKDHEMVIERIHGLVRVVKIHG